VATALDLQTGDIAFAVLIRSFHFEKALMEEHFNENYMESDKMPKATFKGKISNASGIDLSKEGSYEMLAEGDMTIHGVTQKIKVPGTIVVKGGLPQVIAKFKLAPKDYNIKIPSLVADKIEESMAVSVNCRYEKK
jgi:polyisoprenoid-binding protein YceI